MAEWKTQLSYNYNPPYHHAYAYGIMYQAGSEQTHGTLPSWADQGVAELGSYNAGVPQGYFVATARPREESPPRSPEQSVLNLHGHYQSSGVVYLGGSQNSRIGFPEQLPTTYDPLVNDDDGGRARSGTPTSDSEEHTSPDSWSSPSSREEGLPQTDPTAWIQKELYHDPETGSPNTSHDLSSILEKPQSFTAVENEDPNTSCSPVATSKTTPTPKTRRTVRRVKLRTVFSDDQMNVLIQRFSAQRYLTPIEMKNLAAQSGLTYQQVKTWFQNRRMKLRRHQKDTSWVSEHYNTKKAGNVNTDPAVYSMAPLLQQSQGEARSHLQEQYTQHMIEAGSMYKNSPPQNLAYYLAAMGAAGTTSYHGSWSTGGPRTAPLPSRPEGPGWPMASSAQQQPQYAYDYSNPITYSAAGPLATSDDSTANSDSNLDNPLLMALGQSTDLTLSRHGNLLTL